MNKYNIQKNRGFTLIETMIAVFILVLAMNSLLGLLAGSLFAARYAKNDIVANYLTQEAIDYIRNDRDTFAFQQASSGGGWNNFLNRYGYATSTSCFSTDGCEFEPAKMLVTPTTPSDCNSTITSPYSLPCRTLNYDENATNKDFYTYDNTGTLPLSGFKRQIIMTYDNSLPDELDIKVTVEWLNGSVAKSKVSRVSLLNWYKP